MDSVTCRHKQKTPNQIGEEKLANARFLESIYVLLDLLFSKRSCSTTLIESDSLIFLEERKQTFRELVILFFMPSWKCFLASGRGSFFFVEIHHDYLKLIIKKRDVEKLKARTFFIW